MTLWTNMSKRNKIIIAIVAGLAVLALIFGLVVYSQTLPPGRGDNQIELVIPFGSSTAAIANLLEEQGIIKNALLYRIYLRQNDLEGHLQAGTYQLNDGLTYEQVSELLLQGQVLRESVRFTIPEGLKVDQVAARLSNIEVERTAGEVESLIDPEVFLDLVQNGEFDYWFINQIPQDVDYRLEGYLYPATYEVFPTASEWDIINMMLRSFDRVFNEEFQNRAQELGLSAHEVITFASIVEREAGVAHERAKIAGVFYNRLAINMRLQADATVQYLFEEQRDRVLYVDLEIDSPYNTYRYAGLPPGAIASPGRDAIHAVLYPEDHGYYYYVTKKDGSGEHYFAVTYDEHRANIRRSNRN